MDMTHRLRPGAVRLEDVARNWAKEAIGDLAPAGVPSAGNEDGWLGHCGVRLDFADRAVTR